MTTYQDAPAWPKFENLPNFKETGAGQFKASCPGPNHTHGDRNPSLGIVIGEKQQILPTCFVGCTYDDILAAMGCQKRDLYPPTGSAKPERDFRLEDAVAIYDYTDESETILFKVGRFANPKDFRPFAPAGPTWKLGEKGIRRHVPYHLPQLNAASPDEVVLIVEGEKDVERAERAGFVATTTHGGASAPAKSAQELAAAVAGGKVAIIPDADDPGDKYAAAVKKAIAESASSVVIARLPGLQHRKEHGQDLSDWLELGHTADELRALVESAADENSSQSLGVCLADVEVEEFDWVWRGRIARRKITMADGNPGLGKSLATLDFAARIAMGKPMPDGSPGLDAPAGVVIVCGEDGLADTVKPRLLAAGASPDALKRVWAINLVPERLASGEISQRLLSLVNDLGALEAKITDIGAALLIIDPVTAYLGNQTDMYKDSHVRAVLTPLALMAERTGVAILLVRHLNKNADAQALHRGLGGVAFIGVARLGLLFVENPDVEGERLMGRHKGNIGVQPPTWAYRVTQVGDAENMPKIEWLGERDISIGAALAAQGAGPVPRAVDMAVNFLRGELKDGDVPSTEIIDRGKILKFSESTLNRAKSRLKIKAKRKRVDGTDLWVWPQLPHADAQGSQGSQGSQEYQEDQESHADDLPASADKSVASPSADTVDIVGTLGTLGTLHSDSATNGAPTRHDECRKCRRRATWSVDDRGIWACGGCGHVWDTTDNLARKEREAAGTSTI